MRASQMNMDPQMNFDTHKLIKFLVTKGIKTTQAESIVEVVNQSREYDFSKLATKDQLKLLEAKIESTEAKLEAKIEAVRGELKGELKATEERLMGAIMSSKHDMLKWTIPLLVGVILTIFFKH